MCRVLFLQNSVRDKIKINSLRKVHGPAVLLRDRCNNTEDFYTFDDIKDIPQKFFFSYKDSRDIIWGFDIRSLNELLQSNNENPYTRVAFPKSVICEIKLLTAKLVLENLHITHAKVIPDDAHNMIRQRVTDLFSRIEYTGLSCNEDWLYSLTVIDLKLLYRSLEDIWNYRLQLTGDCKIRLCPPNGINFNRLRTITHTHCKDEIIDIIINDVCKFENAQNTNDIKLGYMYFIIGLGRVSRGCFEVHREWLSISL